MIADRNLIFKKIDYNINLHDTDYNFCLNRINFIYPFLET